jgi:hypothetical protein
MKICMTKQVWLLGHLESFGFLDTKNGEIIDETNEDLQKKNQIKIYSCGIKSCDKGYLTHMFCDCHKVDNVLIVE